MFDSLTIAFSMFLHLFSYHIMASNWNLYKSKAHTPHKQAH